MVQEARTTFFGSFFPPAAQNAFVRVESEDLHYLVDAHTSHEIVAVTAKMRGPFVREISETRGQSSIALESIILPIRDDHGGESRDYLLASAHVGFLQHVLIAECDGWKVEFAFDFHRHRSFDIVSQVSIETFAD